MSLLRNSSHRYSSLERSFAQGVARPAILRLQRNPWFFPREICLISGAPRSGTTALCEWLNQQPDVSVFQESRILVSIHRFMEEINRFSNLEKDSAMIAGLARQLVYSYYANSRILVRKRLLVDKEPLEPIAFPAKEYGQFIMNVRRVFPECQLLLAIREPIANIWSMTRRTWGESLTNAETRTFTLEEHIDNWRSCADVVLKFCSDQNTYVVQYGRLISDSRNESKRICDFLNLETGQLFKPRQTKVVGFTTEEREKISQMVQPQLELLRAHDISGL